MEDDCPTEPDERIESLDALRGLALFGVLIVNLQTEFRVPLFRFYSGFHTNPGYANLATDDAIRLLLESKAFAIFSFMFGVGLAMFFKRTGRKERERPVRLLRRLVVLLGLGFLHMLLWNGDILLAYAVTGLLVAPVLFAGPRLAAGLALACAAIQFLPLSLPGLPAHATMVRQGIAATAVYGSGTFGDVFRFRWNETRLYIAPLLLGSLPRIAGLMLAGTAIWRLGLLSNPRSHLRLYQVVALAGLAIGGGGSALELLEQAGRIHLNGLVQRVVSPLDTVPFAFGYVALFFCAVASERGKWLLRLFAPIGRMALTSYVTQSIVLGFVFFGYGLGLCGRLPSAPAALGGIALYAFQIGASRLWLSRFRFGPLEWLWRSLTFGSAQPLRRAPAVLDRARPPH